MSDIATSLISDDEREYLILQKRAISGADDGTYEWALNEIERLREALRDRGEPVAWLHTMHYETDETHEVVDFLEESPFGIPGEDYSAEYKVTTEPLYRAALGEGNND